MAASSNQNKSRKDESFTLLEHCSTGTLLLMQFALGSRAFKQASHLSVLSMHSFNISLHWWFIFECLIYVCRFLPYSRARYTMVFAVARSRHFPFDFFRYSPSWGRLSVTCLPEAPSCRWCGPLKNMSGHDMSRYEEFHRLRWFEWPHAALQLCGAGPRIPPWNSCGRVEAWSVAQVSSEHYITLCMFRQDTDTFLVLGSPAILTRKWCVGEMVTVAQLQVMAPQPGPWWGFGGDVIALDSFADICCERMQTRCLLILFLFCLNRFSYQSECCGQHKLGNNFHLVHTNMVCNSPMFTKKTREAIRPVEKFQHTIIIFSCSSTIIHPLEVLEVLMMWDSVHDVPLVFVLQLYVSGPRHSRIMSIPYYWHGPTSQSQMRLSSRTTPASFRTLEEL